MDHPEGARETGDGRLGFDRRVRLEFRGTQLSSDGGLLVMRELDDVLGLSDLASGATTDTAPGEKRLFNWQYQAILKSDSRLLGECRRI